MASVYVSVCSVCDVEIGRAKNTQQNELDKVTRRTAAVTVHTYKTGSEDWKLCQACVKKVFEVLKRKRS